ncbi:MAG: glutamate-5-semialdehyde dehydrogenase [Actinomycetes bacterium]
MASFNLQESATRVAKAARVLRAASNELRRGAILAMAEALHGQADAVLAANAQDLQAPEALALSPSAQDRLRLDEARLTSMVEGLRTVAALADPLGIEVARDLRPNGLEVSRIRVPLGVIGVIYENRPNVTSDVAALCIRAGSAAFLRGSATALRSNLAIARALRAGASAVGLPEDVLCLVEDPSHEVAVKFMQLNGIIDCLIPRGGPALLASMREHASVPYVIDGDGNCHIFVDKAANLTWASDIAINAKAQRPGVCNAMESLLVHESVAESFLPGLAQSLPQVEFRGCARTRELIPRAAFASEEDYATEFLDLILAVKVVASVDEAIAHIEQYSSGHSEAIITDDAQVAEHFRRSVDAAAVLVNTSTRFVDGGELGLGAEVGISTQKLHWRGPMGLEALTATSWFINGKGQVRP